MAYRISGIPEGFTDSVQIGTPTQQLAKQYDVSERTIQRWKLNLSHTLKLAPSNLVPNPDATDFGVGLIDIDEERLLVTSDHHAPFYDMTMIENSCRVADWLGIRYLILAGDVFDASTLSVFDQENPQYSIGKELEWTKKLFDFLLKRFDKLFWIRGNHEIRFPRITKFGLTLEELGSYLVPTPDRLISSSRPDLDVKSSNIPFRIQHPSTYSKETAKVAATIASKLQRNVLSAHGHFLGFRYDISGQFLGGDLGGMFDYWKLPYIHQRGQTTHPVWNGGFWTITNGTAKPYGNRITDWEAYKPQAKIIDFPDIPTLNLPKAA